jgi:hypothetical protein
MRTYIRHVRVKMSTSVMTDLLLPHLAAAGAAGLNLDNLEAAAPTLIRTQLNNAANYMVQQGVAWKAGRGKYQAHWMRWFASELWAQDWERLNSQAVRPKAAPVQYKQRNRYATAEAEMLEKKHRRDGNKAELRRSNTCRADVLPVITAATVYTIAAKPPDNRFTVTGPVLDGFETAGIGHYAEGCSGWAAAMTGAQP